MRGFLCACICVTVPSSSWAPRLTCLLGKSEERSSSASAMVTGAQPRWSAIEGVTCMLAYVEWITTDSAHQTSPNCWGIQGRQAPVHWQWRKELKLAGLQFEGVACMLAYVRRTTTKHRHHLILGEIGGKELKCISNSNGSLNSLVCNLRGFLVCLHV